MNLIKNLILKGNYFNFSCYIFRNIKIKIIFLNKMEHFHDNSYDLDRYIKWIDVELQLAVAAVMKSTQSF